MAVMHLHPAVLPCGGDVRVLGISDRQIQLLSTRVDLLGGWPMTNDAGRGGLRSHHPRRYPVVQVVVISRLLRGKAKAGSKGLQ